MMPAIDTKIQSQPPGPEGIGLYQYVSLSGSRFSAISNRKSGFRTTQRFRQLSSGDLFAAVWARRMQFSV
jgi:hypothetical protein